MIDPTHRTIVSAFFGPMVGQDDRPEVLLGLAEPPTPATVATALRRRLAVVNSHPRALAPEADQLRLILYGAASQLLAGRMMPPPDPVAITPPPAAPAPPRAIPTRPAANAELVRETINLLGIHGGMTQEALAKLAIAAQARGLGQEAVTAALSQVFYQQDTRPDRPRQPTTPARAATRGPVEVEAQSFEPGPIDPGQRLVRQAVYFVLGLVGLAAAVLGIGGMMFLLGRSAPATPAAAAAAAATPVATTLSNSPRATPPAAVPDAKIAVEDEGVPPDPAGVVHDLRKALDLATTEPEQGATKFVAAHQVAARWWRRLDAGQRTGAIETTIDMLFRLAGTPAGEQVVTAVVEAASPLAVAGVRLTRAGISESAWSAGLLVRLSRDAELPASLRGPVDRTLNAMLGGDRPAANASFSAGAMQALRTMSLRLVSDTASPEAAAAAFERWEQNVRAAAEGLVTTTASGMTLEQAVDQSAEAAILEGLQTLLTVGPEPDADRSISEVLSGAAGRLRWRPGDLSRRRLLAWFIRPDISIADLHTLTTAIVTKSSADGVDLGMVVSAGATDSEREAISRAYANAWSLRPAKTGVDLAQAWVNTARATLATPVGAASSLDDLRWAAVLARINEAAARRDRGDIQGAVEVLTDRVPQAAGITLAQSTSRFSLLSAAGAVGDGQWATGFISSAPLADRQSRLAELEQSGGPAGPADADVLAEAAITTIYGDHRVLAQRVLLKFAENPLVINGLLKALPRAARSATVQSTLIQATQRTLPGWQTERWATDARRAVVERLIEMLAAAPDHGGSALGDVAIDRLAAELAAAYSARAGRAVSSAGIAPLDAAKELSFAAAEHLKQLRLRADRYAPNPNAPWSLERLERRHAGRLLLARGPVQTFAADQVSAAEMLAFIVSGEQPLRAARIKAIVGRMNDERRSARNILTQIRIVEQAVTRLWLVRAGEEES